MKKPGPTVYFGAALFNARESVFNSLLAERLEKEGAKVLLPQRDGFEFSKLHKSLAKKLKKKEVPQALQTIIYLLDIGKYVYESDVVLANLDEPLDEGLVVEMVYAGFMGVPVVGFRTDVRSPFGDLADLLRGIHFFPAFQCSTFISAYISAKRPAQREVEMEVFFQKIWNAIQLDYKMGRLRHYKIDLVRERANTLFEGIDDIHSPQGLKTIVERYMSQRERYDIIWPRVH